MANTLQQQILADATNGGVFFQRNGQGFDEALIHYPAGDLQAGDTVYGVIDRDLEDVGGVGLGEGARFDTPAAVRLKRNAMVELPISVVVTESSGGTGNPSLFEFDGRRWRTVRIVGRDAAMQLVLVTRADRLASRRVQRP